MLSPESTEPALLSQTQRVHSALPLHTSRRPQHRPQPGDTGQEPHRNGPGQRSAQELPSPPWGNPRNRPRPRQGTCERPPSAGPARPCPVCGLRAPRSPPAPPHPVLQLGRELALELAARPSAVVALDEHLARHRRLLRPHRAAAPLPSAPVPSAPPPAPRTYGCRKTAAAPAQGGSAARRHQARQCAGAASEAAERQKRACAKVLVSYWLQRSPQRGQPT